MKLHRILILGAAATLGYFAYYRMHGLVTVAQNVGFHTPDSNGESSSRYSGYGNSGSYRPGLLGLSTSGIGRVGVGGSKHSTKFDSLTASSAPAYTEEEMQLMQAAAKGNKEGLRSLLSQNTNVNARDTDRRTPLMYASWNGQNEMCGLLISAGAQARFQDRNGINAYGYAASRGLSDTLQYLFSRTDIEDDNHYVEYAAIMTAVLYNNATMLPQADGKWASVNRFTPEDQSPLHIAAGAGNGDLVNALIAHGAMINLENNDRQTPLHWAAWNNQAQMVELLKSKGAQLSAHDSAGNTALMFAVQHNNIETVRMLLKIGAPKSDSNHEGKTALMMAEDRDYQQIVALLQ